MFEPAPNPKVLSNVWAVFNLSFSSVAFAVFSAFFSAFDFVGDCSLVEGCSPVLFKICELCPPLPAGACSRPGRWRARTYCWHRPKMEALGSHSPGDAMRAGNVGKSSKYVSNAVPSILVLNSSISRINSGDPARSDIRLYRNISVRTDTYSVRNLEIASTPLSHGKLSRENGLTASLASC